MKFTDIFVKRPVLAIVVNLVILIAGLQAIRSLSVRQYPRSDIAVVQVTTVYVGANADLVRGFITTPLERVIASADGIDYMESSSAQGLSTITVHLKLNYDTNAALTQIQAKVAQVRNDLPPEAEAPIINLETADNQFAAMYLGFSSSDLDQTQITDYLTRVVQPKLSAISGVQRADILGNRTFAMRIWLKPDQMAAHGISPGAVHDALARNNYLSALGRTKGSMVSVNLIANTDLRTAEEFRQLVVQQRKGVVVRLGDIADVVLGAENYDQDVLFNGESATFMGIWVLPTANALDVIGQVRAVLPGLQAQLPAGAPGRARRRARARGSDHRDDDHAGGGLRTHRHPGRSHRLALPRVCLHAGGRGHRLWGRGADAVADDGIEAAAPGREAAWLRGVDQPAVRFGPRRIHTRARLDARLPACRPDAVGHRRAADRAVLHVLAARAGAGRGPGGGLLGRAGRAERDDRADEALHLADPGRLQVAPRNGRDVPADLPQRRLRRHGDQAVERTVQDRTAARSEEHTSEVQS